MGTPQPDTRRRLLHTAADLLWERSYHGISVDELCARADARKGSFYHFFPSKEALAGEALLESWRRTKAEVFEPIFGGTAGGLAVLQRFVDTVDEVQRGLCERGGHCLGCLFGGLGQELAHQDDLLCGIIRDIFEEHCDYFERALVQAIEQGEIPRCDTRARARAMFALMEGALLLARVADNPAVFRDIAPSILFIATQP